MATLASLLVAVGVKLDGDLKVESKLRGLRKAVQDLASNATKDTSVFASAFSSMAKGVRGVASQLTDQLKESFQGVDVSIGGMTMRLGGLPGIAAAAGQAIAGVAAEAFRLMESQTASMDETMKLSRALGINVEELQRLQHAAGMSGVSTEALSTGMKKFNANLLAMQGGGGRKAKEALEQIGLSLRDLQGKSRTEQIGMIADKLNGVANAADRSAIAAEIFGKASGPQMASLLAEGSEGIRALAAEAQGVFNEEDGARAEEFQDNLTRIQARVDSLARTIAIELLPVAADIAQAVLDWTRENDTLIRQPIVQFARDFADALRFVRDETRDVVTLGGELNNMFHSMGVEGNAAVTALDLVKKTVGYLVAPFTSVRRVIHDATSALVAFGIMSESMATQVGVVSEEDIRKKLESKMKALGLDVGSSDSGDASEDVGGVTSNRSMKSMAPEIAKLREKEKEARKRGDQRAADKAAREAEKKEREERRAAEAAAREARGLTWSEFGREVRRGNMDAVNQRMKDFSAGSGTSMGDKMPSVVVTMNNLDVDIHVASTNPREAGKEMEMAFNRMFRSKLTPASRALGGTVR
jgi:hypothetical protein